MKTKFISFEGFEEIKSLPVSKKRKNTLTTAEKTLRFIKRIPKEMGRDFKSISKKFRNINWKTLTPKKFFKGVRNFHIDNSYFESMRSPKGIATMLAPVCAALVLVLTVCFWTCNDSSLTVNVDGQRIATIDNEQVLTQASAQMHSALSATDTDEASAVPVMQITLPSFSSDENASVSDVYEMLVVHNEGIVANYSGLYVDGEFFGATEDTDGLSDALTQILADAKDRFDDTTVTSFNNDVAVETGVYSEADVKSVEEIIENAQPYFSIRLETDLVCENVVPFETTYEYDDTMYENKSEVKVAGEDGLQKVVSRLVYVDGALADNIIVSVEDVKEPTTEVVIKGTKLSYEATGDFLWPVPYTNYISSPFGPRWGTIHRGIDIAGSGIENQDIVASDSGTVIWSGYDNSGYGNYVIIDHGNGYKTLYGHANALYVSTGEKVYKGDVIAAVGSTGFSTGPHLHFEIIENEVKVDPELYL